ncbi:MAG: GNAT family N-acetyltransferase [Chloroflexota bacterium]
MITGERITLRAIARDDLPRYVTWLNDPEVIRHLSPHRPLTLDDETDWYERQRKESTTQNFASVITEAAQHIGSIGLRLINHRDQNAELGIFIGDKRQWGQGYAQEAIKLLLHFAFTEMNLHRIYLVVDVANQWAVHCYKKCGFIEEGRLRDAVYHRGDFEDQLIMSVLRSEYMKES